MIKEATLRNVYNGLPAYPISPYLPYPYVSLSQSPTPLLAPWLVVPDQSP